MADIESLFVSFIKEMPSKRSSNRFPDTRRRAAHAKKPNNADLVGPPPVITAQLALLAIVVGICSALLWKGRNRSDDWAPQWIAGLLVSRNQAAHIYDHDPEEFSTISGDVWYGVAGELPELWVHPFVQNPLVAYAMSFVVRVMSFETSTLVLAFLSGISITVLVASTYHLWRRRTIPIGIAALVTVATLGFPAVTDSFWLGQTTPLILGCLSFALAVSRRRPIISGVLLAFVSIVKLSPIAIVVVMCFFAYRRKAALIALSGNIVMAIVLFLVVDRSITAAWLERMGDVSDSVLIGMANQSLSGLLLARGEDVPIPIISVEDYPLWVRVVPVLVAFVFVVAALVVAWLHRTRSFEILVVSAWLVATCFSVIVWSHYSLSLIFPVMGLWLLAEEKKLRVWMQFTIAAVLFMVIFPGQTPLVIGPDLSGHHYFALLAMLIAFAALLVGSYVHWRLLVSGKDGIVERIQGEHGEPMLLFDMFVKSPGGRHRA